MREIPGLTEQEVIDIIYEACRQVAPKYKFGYHSPEDLIQQGVMESIAAIDEGKFRPRGNKDIKTQLLNFLRVNCRNRVSNYLRKHSFRYANPESKNNVSKYNIMHPLKIHSQGLTNSEIFSRENSISQEVDSKEIADKLRAELPMNFFKDYLRWQNGVKLSSIRKKALFDKILEVLGDGYY